MSAFFTMLLSEKDSRPFHSANMGQSNLHRRLGSLEELQS